MAAIDAIGTVAPPVRPAGALAVAVDNPPMTQANAASTAWLTVTAWPW
jgi:hypothetical protein